MADKNEYKIDGQPLIEKYANSENSVSLEGSFKILNYAGLENIEWVKGPSNSQQQYKGYYSSVESGRNVGYDYFPFATQQYVRDNLYTNYPANIPQSHIRTLGGYYYFRWNSDKQCVEYAYSSTAVPESKKNPSKVTWTYITSKREIWFDVCAYGGTASEFRTEGDKTSGTDAFYVYGGAAGGGAASCSGIKLNFSQQFVIQNDLWAVCLQLPSSNNAPARIYKHVNSSKLPYIELDSGKSSTDKNNAGVYMGGTGGDYRVVNSTIENVFSGYLESPRYQISKGGKGGDGCRIVLYGNKKDSKYEVPGNGTNASPRELGLIEVDGKIPTKPPYVGYGGSAASTKNSYIKKYNVPKETGFPPSINGIKFGDNTQFNSENQPIHGGYGGCAMYCDASPQSKQFGRGGYMDIVSGSNVKRDPGKAAIVLYY